MSITPSHGFNSQSPTVQKRSAAYLGGHPGKRVRLSPVGEDTVSLQGADAPLTDEELQRKGSALLWNVQQYNPPVLETVKTMIRKVPKNQCANVITWADNYGRTPFMWAVEHGYLEMAKAFIAKVPQEQIAAMLNQAGHEVTTASLREDVNNNNPTMVAAKLAALPEDQRFGMLTQDDESENSPFLQAVHHNQLAMVQVMLNAVPADQHAAMLNHIYQADDEVIDTPLTTAINNNNLAMVRAMLPAVPADQRAAMVTDIDRYESSSLITAAVSQNPAMVRAIFNAVPVNQHAAMLNQTNADGETQLQILERRQGDLGVENSLTAAAVLIAYGANEAQITNEFRDSVKQHLTTQCDQHGATLLNPEATPEEVQQASKWFQLFPPNGGALDWKQSDTEREIRQSQQRAEQEAILHDPNTTPQQKAQAQAQLEQLNWKPLSKQFNSFIRNQENKLKTLSDDEAKHKILDRTHPLLRAGVPVNLGGILPKTAEALNRKDWLADAVQADGSFTVNQAFLRLTSPLFSKRERVNVQAEMQQSTAANLEDVD